MAGCAEKSTMQVDRYQFDDLRDADQDGIINQRDRCLITPLNTQVDNEGCALWSEEEQISWFPIFFEFDQSKILAENFTELDRAVMHLQNNVQTQLVLIGDTSHEGTNDYNKALAERRNQSVKVYLMEKGIDCARIQLQTFDQKTPFTALLKARKRRTIAVFIDKDKVFTETWHLYTTEAENK